MVQKSFQKPNWKVNSKVKAFSFFESFVKNPYFFHMSQGVLRKTTTFLRKKYVMG